MKRLLLSALAAAVSLTCLWAETKTPYTEQFDEAVVRPKGWNKYASSSYAAGTFTPVATGGHSGGYMKIDQYSNYKSSYGTPSWYYSDILISPKVSGEVTLWVRKDGSDPTLTVYNMGDGTTVPTTLTPIDGNLNLLEGKDVNDWTRVTLCAPTELTAIGIRAHNLDIDEFSAATAEVLYRVGVTGSITNNTETVSYNRVAEDADGNITFKFDVTLTNVGDVDIPLIDQGFKIELINTTADNAVFGTDYIAQAIPYAGAVQQSFTMTAKPVIVGTTTNSYSVRISHPNLGSPVTGSLCSVIVVPYAPVAEFMLLETNDSKYSPTGDDYVNATSTITIGQGAAGTSRTMWMWNAGTAPLEITSTAVSAGFECDAAAFTLQPKEKKAVTVKLAGDAGYREGTITFTDKKLGEIKYDIDGMITAEGRFTDDLEDGATGWILNGWKISKDTKPELATLGKTGWIESLTSINYATKAISPKISFARGDKLYFMAAKTDNYGSELKVYTSPDRSTWTQAARITSRGNEDGATDKFNDNRANAAYGSWDFEIFSIDMPEGESYIAFEAGNVRIDNLYGGSPVAVAHDIYASQVNLPQESSVNTRYIASVVAENLGAEPESGYAVVLEVDGKQVAEAPDTPEMKTNEKITYSMRYTPHDEGTHPAKIVFVKGDDRVELAAFDITVGPEKVEAVYQAGTEKICSTDLMNTSYGGNQTQVVYTRDILGIDPGNKILGVYFTGYNNYEITKHVRVWIQNTDAEGYDKDNIAAEPKENMTLVYDGDYAFTKCGDYYKDIYVPVLDIRFTVPFEYTGGNLRVMVEQTSAENDDANCKSTFYRIDNTLRPNDTRMIKNPQDYAEDLEDEAKWYLYNTGIPVAYFTVAKDVVTVKGMVTDDFGTPVEGALLSLASDDILYTAVSDEAGAYVMNVANVQLVYTLSAEAEGFDPASKPGVSLDAKQPECICDIALAWTDRTATLSGHVYDSTAAAGTAAPGVEITLTSGEHTVTATVGADGAYSVTVPDFSLPYAVSITQDGVARYSNVHTFASKADTADYQIAYDDIIEIGSDSDKAEYYDLQGTRVSRPEPGRVYIRTIGGRASKVLVR